MQPRTMWRRVCASLVMAACFSLTPLPASTEPETADAVISLVEAFELAQANAPAVRSAKHEVQAQQKAEEGARGQLYPTITLDATGARSEFETADASIDPRTLQRTVSTTEVTETQTTVGLNLSQPIYDRRAIETIDRAESQTRTAEQRVAAARHELAAQVAESYVRVLRERAVLELGRAEEKAFALQVRQMEKRLERGLTDRLALLEAQVRLDEARSRISQARNRLEVARLELERLTGRPINRLRAADPTAMVDVQPPDDQTVSEWKQQAAVKNPEVRVALERLETARQEVDLRRADRYPTVSLQLSYSDTDRTDQVVSGEQARAMLVLEMPLYSGGRVSAGVEEASARADSEQARVDEARRRAVLDARRAANELRTSSQRLRTLARSLETAQTAVTAAERGLEQGLRDRVEVLEARAREFRIRRDLADAAYSRLNALVRVRQLTGTIDRERLSALDERYLDRVVDVRSPPAPSSEAQE